MFDEKIKEMATSYGRKEEELSKNEALVEYLRNSVKTLAIPLLYFLQ